MPLMKIVSGSLLGVLLALFATQGSATGILKLSRTELKLGPDMPVNELYVENIGDTPLYLVVEQKLLLNPGQTLEQLVPIEETERPTLLVTPGRLVLAPGQKQRMVLKELMVPSRTLVWRVTFRPKEQLVIDEGAGAQAPLVVSVGYGVVIYQSGTDRGR